jgi:hypothetical protein
VRLDVRSAGDAMPALAKCNLRLPDTITLLAEEKRSLRQDFSDSDHPTCAVDDPTGAVALDRLGNGAPPASA